MTEPDFDQIARTFMETFGRYSFAHPLYEEERIAVVNMLRQVWNARGAADADKLQALDVLDHGDLVVRVFTGAIKALDR